MDHPVYKFMSLKNIGALRKIKEYFGFLFESGYSVTNVEPADSYNHWHWLIDLESKTHHIQFCEDRDELFILMGPKGVVTGRYSVRLHDLSLLIFYLSGDKEQIGALKNSDYKRASDILKTHLTKLEEILSPANYLDFEEKIKQSLEKFDESLNSALINKLKGSHQGLFNDEKRSYKSYLIRIALLLFVLVLLIAYNWLFLK
jgi:hypothetical protein